MVQIFIQKKHQLPMYSEALVSQLNKALLSLYTMSTHEQEYIQITLEQNSFRVWLVLSL